MIAFSFKVNRLSILAVWTKGKVKHPSQITEIYVLCHQVMLPPLNAEEMFAMVSLTLCSFWLHLLFSVKRTITHSLNRSLRLL